MRAILKKRKGTPVPSLFDDPIDILNHGDNDEVNSWLRHKREDSRGKVLEIESITKPRGAT